MRRKHWSTSKTSLGRRNRDQNNTRKARRTKYMRKDREAIKLAHKARQLLCAIERYKGTDMDRLFAFKRQANDIEGRIDRFLDTAAGVHEVLFDACAAAAFCFQRLEEQMARLAHEWPEPDF